MDGSANFSLICLYLVLFSLPISDLDSLPLPLTEASWEGRIWDGASLPPIQV